MRIHQYLLLLLVITPLSCVKAKDTKSLSIEGGFQLLIPTNVSVLTESPVEDFVLYNLSTLEEGRFLILYIGNYSASTTDIPKSADSFSKAISGYPSKFVKWSDDDGLFNGDTYITLLKSNRWPSTAHFMYRKVTSEQQLKIEKIIYSFAKK